jgi:pimeloyl-ACP methyl ester carboxylesterase
MARWSFVAALINECGDHFTMRRDFGYAGARGSCLTNDSPKGRILDGLGVQIWTRGKPGGSFCPEAVIAFRGTDARQADDWLTNFRSITRVLPLYDQYSQVQDHISAIIDRVEGLPCYRRGRTKLIAVGHSLGGGLAQQAAYRDGRIRRVYAFDPSFVTGFYDVSPDLREKNARGLEIERIYEHGEILAYPRLILRNIYPPTPCHPQIRHIRFNIQYGGTIVSQHSMVRFSEELLRHSGRTPARAAAAAGIAHLPVSDLAACATADRVT